MSWSNLSKNLATFVNTAKSVLLGYLLKEDGFYLLLETGDKIILEESSGTWTLGTKHTS